MYEMFQMSCGTLVDEFSDLGIEVEDQDVLAQLAILCQRYNIDNSKVSCEYFAFWLWWVLFYSAHLRTDSDTDISLPYLGLIY